MDQIAIWSRMEVKPGKQRELEQFLEYSKRLIDLEPGTTSFYALRENESIYHTFATFADESACEAHIHGQVPKAIATKADDLFLKPMEITKTRILEFPLSP